MMIRLLGGVALAVATAGVSWAQSNPPAPLPKSKPATGAAQPVPAKELPASGKTTPAIPAAPSTAVTPASPAVPATGALATPGSTMLNSACPTACPQPCTTCCVPCGPPGQFWIDAGWLFWTTSGQNVPPLVTTAPPGTPRDAAGALGQPGTSVLYPTNSLNGDWRSGFYVNVGMWFDCCQTCGFETNFFFLGDSNDNYSASSNGSQIITRPFYNTTLGRQDTELVSYPEILSGGVSVNSETSVWGINPNMIKNVCCGPCGRFDVLLGFYYLNVSDNLVIREDLTSLPGQSNVAPGTRFLIEDSFRSNNDFYAVNIGFAFERRFSHWFLGLRSGIAMGNIHQSVDINGSTTIIPPGGTPTTYAGGLLTQPSNIGHYERDMFAVMPWVGLRLGCQVTTRLRTYVGYDFLWLSNVARAGEQIDPRVNTTQIAPRTEPVTGPLYPQFNWNASPFTIHGIRIGAEYRF